MSYGDAAEQEGLQEKIKTLLYYNGVKKASVDEIMEMICELKSMAYHDGGLTYTSEAATYPSDK